MALCRTAHINPDHDQLMSGDSAIVLYDDSRTALTSRLYFMLELHGLNMDRVRIRSRNRLFVPQQSLLASVSAQGLSSI